MLVPLWKSREGQTNFRGTAFVSEANERVSRAKDFSVYPSLSSPSPSTPPPPAPNPFLQPQRCDEVFTIYRVGKTGERKGDLVGMNGKPTAALLAPAVVCAGCMLEYLGSPAPDILT